MNDAVVVGGGLAGLASATYLECLLDAEGRIAEFYWVSASRKLSALRLGREPVEKP